MQDGGAVADSDDGLSLQPSAASIPFPISTTTGTLPVAVTPPPLPNGGRLKKRREGAAADPSDADPYMPTETVEIFVIGDETIIIEFMPGPAATTTTKLLGVQKINDNGQFTTTDDYPVSGTSTLARPLVIQPFNPTTTPSTPSVDNSTPVRPQITATFGPGSAAESSTRLANGSGNGVRTVSGAVTISGTAASTGGGNIGGGKISGGDIGGGSIGGGGNGGSNGGGSGSAPTPGGSHQTGTAVATNNAPGATGANSVQSGTTVSSGDWPQVTSTGTLVPSALNTAAGTQTSPMAVGLIVSVLCIVVVASVSLVLVARRRRLRKRGISIPDSASYGSGSSLKPSGSGGGSLSTSSVSDVEIAVGGGADKRGAYLPDRLANDKSAAATWLAKSASASEVGWSAPATPEAATTRSFGDSDNQHTSYSALSLTSSDPLLSPTILAPKSPTNMELLADILNTAFPPSPSPDASAAASLTSLAIPSAAFLKSSAPHTTSPLSRPISPTSPTSPNSPAFALSSRSTSASPPSEINPVMTLASSRSPAVIRENPFTSDLDHDAEHEHEEDEVFEVPVQQQSPFRVAINPFADPLQSAGLGVVSADGVHPVDFIDPEDGSLEGWGVSEAEAARVSMLSTASMTDERAAAMAEWYRYQAAAAPGHGAASTLMTGVNYHHGQPMPIPVLMDGSAALGVSNIGYGYGEDQGMMMMVPVLPVVPGSVEEMRMLMMLGMMAPAPGTDGGVHHVDDEDEDDESNPFRGGFRHHHPASVPRTVEEEPEEELEDEDASGGMSGARRAPREAIASSRGRLSRSVPVRPSPLRQLALRASILSFESGRSVSSAGSGNASSAAGHTNGGPPSLGVGIERDRISLASDDAGAM
ncbi:hypothetical protein HK101_001468 [Irineochytrium annulatum]|nr:hypothetical protein HK101_001468 [Irineochytrium annulatum]